MNTISKDKFEVLTALSVHNKSINIDADIFQSLVIEFLDKNKHNNVNYHTFGQIFINNDSVALLKSELEEIDYTYHSTNEFLYFFSDSVLGKFKYNNNGLDDGYILYTNDSDKDLLSGIIDKVADNSRKIEIRWYTDANGNYYNIVEMYNDVVYDSMYPNITIGVDNYINDFLNSKSSILVLLGNPGTGKCFGRDTMIRMYDGSVKAVQNIVDGEYVMGDDSTPRLVSGVTSGLDELYRITPNKGKSFIVNSEHILSYKIKQATETTHNISVKDFLNKNDTHKKRAKLYRASIEYPEVDINICPYFLGLWLGDGTSKNLSITSPDVEIGEYLSEYVEKLGGYYALSKSELQSNSCYTYNITHGHSRGNVSSLLVEFRLLNLFKNKHIPRAYMINSRENRLKLLAGLLDTDGWLQNNTFEITQKSDRLSDDIIELAKSLGFLVSHRKKISKIKSINFEGEYNRIFISGNTDEIPTKILRKKASTRKQPKDVLRTSFNVESIGVGEYFGFLLDGNHLFCLEDFTVVHNTGFIRYLMSKMGKKAYLTYNHDLFKNDEMFAQFVSSTSSGAFIIEDADVLLKSRESGNELMQKFLQLGEGVIKLNGKKLIFSTNLPSTKDIDEALLRKGRCHDVLEFRPMTFDEANIACKDLKLEPLTENREYKLTEIFNRGKVKKQKSVGFY